MSDAMLEDMAKRLADIERKVAALGSPSKDWRTSVGVFEGGEFAAKNLTRNNADQRSGEGNRGSCLPT
jgi:hypothetical protein